MNAEIGVTLVNNKALSSNYSVKRRGRYSLETRWNMNDAYGPIIGFAIHRIRKIFLREDTSIKSFGTDFLQFGKTGSSMKFPPLSAKTPITQFGDTIKPCHISSISTSSCPHKECFIVHLKGWTAADDGRQTTHLERLFANALDRSSDGEVHNTC